MTSQALDYPAELAERAYAHSQVPNKAAKMHTAFIEHMDEVKGTLEAIAKTERQQNLLDQMMVSYRRGYIARLSNVLQLRIKTPEETTDSGKLSRFGREDMAFRQWQRKAQRDMRDDIRNVEQPGARWVDRVEQPASAAASRIS